MTFLFFFFFLRTPEISQKMCGFLRDNLFLFLSFGKHLLAVSLTIPVLGLERVGPWPQKLGSCLHLWYQARIKPHILLISSPNRPEKLSYNLQLCTFLQLCTNSTLLTTLHQRQFPLYFHFCLQFLPVFLSLKCRKLFNPSFQLSLVVLLDHHFNYLKEFLLFAPPIVFQSFSFLKVLAVYNFAHDLAIASNN